MAEVRSVGLLALAEIVPRALLFDGDVYLNVGDSPRAARDGLLLLLALGAALGLASASGAILAWSALPRLADAQRVLGRGLAALPLATRLGPARQGLTALARSAPFWLAARWERPAPLLALARLLAVPSELLLGWLGFGAAAHGLARLLGGRGSLARTLGCTALAEAPRAILLLPFLPPLGLWGLGVAAWVLAARFQAVRAAHGLDGWRAFWATLLAAALVAGLAGLLAAAAWAAVA